MKETLKSLRNSKKMTQRELADKLGISPSTIGMYETGKREPDSEMLKKIADFFNVTTDYLLGHNSLNDIFDIDGDIAAHLKGKEYSESAKKSILDFINFVDSQDN